jgi:superfamily I DNA/RNA helicase
MVAAAAVGIDHTVVAAELAQLHAALTRYENLVHEVPTTSILTKFLGESGLTRLHADSTSQRIEAEGEAIAQFLWHIASLEQKLVLRGDGTSAFAPASFLIPHMCSLWQAGDPGIVDYEEDAGDRVTVATIHGVKGLEFSAVVLSCATAHHLDYKTKRGGTFDVPQMYAANALDATDVEATRLVYVAITRASQEVAITYARNYSGKAGYLPSKYVEIVLDSQSR